MTLSYLGEDWDVYGPTIDDAIAVFVREADTNDLAASIQGLEELLTSSMTEEELDRQWVVTLHSGYDPRDDGYTYREWFAHALDILRARSGTPTD